MKTFIIRPKRSVKDLPEDWREKISSLPEVEHLSSFGKTVRASAPSFESFSSLGEDFLIEESNIWTTQTKEE